MPKSDALNRTMWYKINLNKTVLLNEMKVMMGDNSLYFAFRILNLKLQIHGFSVRYHLNGSSYICVLKNYFEVGWMPHLLHK